MKVNRKICGFVLVAISVTTVTASPKGGTSGPPAAPEIVLRPQGWFDVLVMNADGSNVATVTTGGDTPNWFPGGKGTAEDPWRVVRTLSSNRGVRISFVQLVNGTPTRAKEVDVPTQWLATSSAPHPFATDTLLAAEGVGYVSDPAATSRLFTHSLLAGAPYEVLYDTNTAIGQGYVVPLCAWNGDGSRAAFTVWRRTRSAPLQLDARLMVLDDYYGSRRAIRINLPPEFGLDMLSQPDWSPVSNVVAFGAYIAGDWSLFTVDVTEALLADPSAPAPLLTPTRIADGYGPSFSPDGMKLVYSNRALYVYDLRTRASTRISRYEGLAKWRER